MNMLRPHSHRLGHQAELEIKALPHSARVPSDSAGMKKNTSYTLGERQGYLPPGEVEILTRHKEAQRQVAERKNLGRHWLSRQQAQEETP